MHLFGILKQLANPQTQIWDKINHNRDNSDTVPVEMELIYVRN